MYQQVLLLDIIPWAYLKKKQQKTKKKTSVRITKPLLRI